MSTGLFLGGECLQMILQSAPTGGGLPCLPRKLTPRNPSLLLVMDSGSRGWNRASMLSVSSLGSGGSSSSSLAAGIDPMRQECWGGPALRLQGLTSLRKSAPSMLADEGSQAGSWVHS